jgi:hypothetical protein
MIFTFDQFIKENLYHKKDSLDNDMFIPFYSEEDEVGYDKSGDLIIPLRKNITIRKTGGDINYYQIYSWLNNIGGKTRGNFLKMIKADPSSELAVGLVDFAIEKFKDIKRIEEYDVVIHLNLDNLLMSKMIEGLKKYLRNDVLFVEIVKSDLKDIKVNYEKLKKYDTIEKKERLMKSYRRATETGVLVRKNFQNMWHRHLFTNYLKINDSIPEEFLNGIEGKKVLIVDDLSATLGTFKEVVKITKRYNPQGIEGFFLF